MTERDESPRGFFHELQRRHVVRTGAAYAAVVFVLLQLGEIILPAFLSPMESDSLIRFLVVGALLFTPVVLMVAWVYEITPMGIRSMEQVDAESGVTHLGQSLSHRLAFLVVTVLAVGAAGVWWWRTGEGIPDISGLRTAGVFQGARTTDAQGPIASLAVLPLEDLSSEAGQEYFAPGMHEALVSELSQATSLRVISRNSVVQYSRQGKSTPQVGQELNVDALVTGSVLRAEGRVRISVQLVHAASDTQLWSESYERDLEDVIALQREVSQSIAQAIESRLQARGSDPAKLAAADPVTDAPSGETASDAGSLSGTGAPSQPGESLPPASAPARDSAQSEAAVQPVPSLSVEAQEKLMRGRMVLMGDVSGDPSQAEGYFQDVLAEDSTYAPALSGLATAFMTKGLEEMDLQRLQEAREFASRAIELGSGSSEAREILRGVDQAILVVQGAGEEVQGTGEAIGVMVEAPQSSLGSLVQERIARVEMGEGGRGEEEAHRWTLRGFYRLLGAGRLESAEEVGRRALEEDEGDPLLWEAMEQIQRLQGDVEGLVDIRRRRWRAQGPVGGPSLRDMVRRMESQGEAGYWSWKEEETAARQDADLPFARTTLATARLARGDADGALAALEEAAAAREPLLALVRHDPVWDSMRTDPRFKGIFQGLRERAPEGRGDEVFEPGW